MQHVLIKIRKIQRTLETCVLKIQFPIWFNEQATWLQAKHLAKLWQINRNLDVSYYNLVVYIMNQKTVVPFNPLMKRFKRDKRMILTSSLVKKASKCGENYTLHIFFHSCSR